MAHSLDYIFRPKSIAVIGASTQKGSIGWQLLNNLVEYEFNGKLFPVNPKATVLHSMKCYPSVLEIPDEVDCAILVVPKELVLNVVDQCGQKGIKGMVIITAGFKETGLKGAELEKKLAEKLVQYGIRMVGPNCFGVINTDPDVRMNATFGKTQPLAGKIGFMSQSGALGEAILYYAEQLRIGFSMFASVGNKTNVSGNDLLEYWREDKNTEMILLYVENFGNPRKFNKIARQISKKKPIIVVKSGRTAAGAKAAKSHTGVIAGLDIGVDALLEQSGVLRVSSMEELFDLSMGFSMQPVPSGNSVAVVTNAGGPGILFTDAASNLGLEITQLSVETKDFLRKNLREEAAIDNPVDLIASATPQEYSLALDKIFQDENVDVVVVIFVQPITADELATAKAIVEVKKRYSKPMLSCFMGVAPRSEGVKLLMENNIPTYIFPESIAKTLSAMVKYKRWIEKPEGKIVSFTGAKEKVQKIIDETLQKNKTQITGEKALDIFDAYKIPIAPYQIAETREEVVPIAKKIGFPVVLKIHNSEILHKTELGGVLLDLRAEEEVRAGFLDLKKKVEEQNLSFCGVVVQKMIKGGVETVLGMTTDPIFGPLIMFGLGGINVEILKDVSFKVHPLTDQDAEEMIKSLKGYPLLTGFRGSKPVDIQELQSSLLKLSQLVTDFPLIDQIDINPFIASEKKENTRAVDARIILRK